MGAGGAAASGAAGAVGGVSAGTGVEAAASSGAVTGGAGMPGSESAMGAEGGAVGGQVTSAAGAVVGGGAAVAGITRTPPENMTYIPKPGEDAQTVARTLIHKGGGAKKSK